MNYFNIVDSFRAKDHTLAGCTDEMLSNLALGDLLLGDRCVVRVNQSSYSGVSVKLSSS